MTNTDYSHRGRIPLAGRLIIEWQRLARQPHNIRRANALGLPGEPVEHLDQILKRCGLNDSSNAPHFDEYLSQLLSHAQDDDLATRMVLQRILPGLITAASRRAPRVQNGLPAAFDQALSAAWIVIRRFPVDRRPQRVAANLLMDIEYLAFVRDARLKMNRSEYHLAPEAMFGIEYERSRTGAISNDPVGEAAALGLLLDELRQKGLSPKDIQMLQAICADINSVQASPALNINPRSVRNRRERALRKARKIMLDEATREDEI